MNPTLELTNGVFGCHLFVLFHSLFDSVCTLGYLLIFFFK